MKFSLIRARASVIAMLGAFSLCASSASGAEPGLATGFSGALKGCQEWVLNPKSWVEGPEPFKAATGLGDRITPLSKVGDFALPPPALRQANHYWRIDATPVAGFVLVTSDRLPMCHITGAGQGDFHTAIASVLAGPAFQAQWEQTGEQLSGELTSTTFRSRAKPTFGLVVSRATQAGERPGGVQLVATAQLDLAR